MKKVTILMFLAVAFAMALFGDDATELKSLQGEMSQIQAAERAIEETVKKDNPADAILKLIRDESLARLYEKWSGEKWSVFASAIEREISTADRRYKIPEATPGAAQEMLAILEPNLKALKKKYLAMSKGDPGWENLTRQMVEQKKKVDEFKKQAEEEKSTDEKKIAKVIVARQKAFLNISKKITSKLQAETERPLRSKMESIESGIASKGREGKDREERVGEANKKAKDEGEEKVDLLIAAQLAKLKNRYVETKTWYVNHLRYNDLSEPTITLDGEDGRGIHCAFFGKDGDRLITKRKIIIDYMDGVLTYSSNVVSGYAQDLIKAAVLIFVYEHPDCRPTNWDTVRQLLGDDFGELGNLMKMKRRYYCPECDGLGYVEKEYRCRDCGGRGAGACPSCKNSGWVQCTACKVAGKSCVFKKGCTTCNGSHRIMCPTCYGGAQSRIGSTCL